VTHSLARSDITCQDGDVSFEFISGNTALDFIGTLEARESDRQERLATPADLEQWVVAASLAPHVRVSATAFQSAIELREALWRCLISLVPRRRERDELSDADVLIVNTWAGRPPPALALATDGSVSATGSTQACLAVIARSAVELIGSSDLERTRWCSDIACTRAFIDHSRAGNRRWCGMAGCGDRAKAAQYRARRTRARREASSRPPA
jgi:predicted RNA-binding Zn ribbon-like protein